MIVKLIIHKQLDAISIWNKDGERLFYSDKENDIKTAKELLTIQKKKTDAEIAEEIMSGKKATPRFELMMNGYFKAYWKNKIVQLQERAKGYTW